MNQLTLEWVEAGKAKVQILDDHRPTKNPGTTRIGRDPVRCDVILPDPTVSGLHVEIFFDVPRQGFFLRNLRDTNPPVINRQRLTQGEVMLQKGMSFYLGQVELKVTAIALGSVPQTVIVPPAQTVATATATAPTAYPPAKPQTPSYGLMCPKCQQVSPYDRLGSGCPWCGTSLAAAASVLMIPGDK
ncbi:FHA domain-containing protein [Oscillatoria sp. FACHB-1407]|uniref:FHA domain-containing protein n=1 Tax=Oscillatoria sp. FACHB-1407 TaxID=2692847 RepID=UPI001688FDC5|nr:FHA domain-containing protein [Oscillatoria sp. FACHB-1407]MBD2459821.1 FHA domain-containing protein [Oscillatoria sp. FACHB-1407]